MRASVVLAAVLCACAAAPSAAFRDTRARQPPVPMARVDFRVLPEDGSDWLTDLIDAARQRVHMTMYLASDERTVASLAKAAARGVDTRAMIEGDVPASAATANLQTIETLRRAGATTRKPSPAFRLTHEKSLLIDGKLVITTANLTRSALAGNREFAVILEDPDAVSEAGRAFAADWDRAPFEPAHPALVWSPNNARQRWEWLISQARRSLDIYTETATDRGVAQAFGAAARRGVAVRVIISPAPTPTDPNGPGLDEMQRAGLRVRLLRSPYIHAKAIVSDRSIAYVGSTNVSSTSLDYNRELGVLISDPVALARLAATFERDWARAVDR